MELVVRTAHGDAEVAVESSRRDVAIRDVVQAVLGAPAPTVVRIDRRVVHTATPLGSSGAVVGSVIEVDEPPTPTGDRVVEVVQTAGPGSGRRAALTVGSFLVGPSRRINAAPLSDAPVEEPVIRIDVASDGIVRVGSVSGRFVPGRRSERADEDLGSAPGSPVGPPGDRTPDEGSWSRPAEADIVMSPVPAWLDGVELTDRSELWTTGSLAVGGRVFELRRPDRDSAGTGRRFVGITNRGTVAFNRQWRPEIPAEPGPVVVPVDTGGSRRARHLPLVAMLAPIPIAIGLAVLLGSSPVLALGLVSPIVAVWWSAAERRRRSQGLDAEVAPDADPAARFRALVAERHRAARRRLVQSGLDAVDIVELASSGEAPLWACRPGDDDVFRCSLGLGDLPWRPVLERSNDSLTSAQAIIDELGPLRTVPVEADLRSERGVGVVGDDEFVAAMVRGIVLSACTAHGPADLDLVVLTSPERVATWEWAKWLPHVRTAGTPRVLTDVDQVAGWASAVVRGWEPPDRATAPSHLTLVVVDDAIWWRDRAAPLRPLISDPTLPLRFLGSADSAAGLPAVCTTVVTGEPGDTASVEYLLEGRIVRAVAPLLLAEPIALAAARDLAPLDDPELPVAIEGSLPSIVPIARLLELPRIDADAIRSQWMPGRRPATPVVAIGIAERGPLNVDLVDDGPHGLIAGTTGSGKTELLRSLIVGLAANLQPDEINFVLVDVKGGAAFDACARLPHCVGLLTDLDRHAAARLLRGLRAEVRRREAALRAAGVASLHVYHRIDGLEPLPRLMIVVDEIASIAAELPEFLPSLIDIVQQGRSLGFHMILGTRRPAGVVDNAIKAVTNLRVALRVQDAGDSFDVIGSPEAATLPRRVPGRAYARFAAGELTQFQSAHATGTHRGDDDHVDVRPWVLGRPLTPLENRLARRTARDRHDRTGRGSATGGPGTDLDHLVDAIRSASDSLGQSGQWPPTPPPLPESLPLAELFSTHQGDAVPIGLADLPDEQRQTPVWWTPGPEGGRLAYGVAGAGTSSLLVSLALGIAHRYSADDVHVVAIDADTDALVPLAALPHCGAVIRLDEGERVARLARELGAELDRRRQLAVELGGASLVAAREPTVVVLIDNLGALRRMLDAQFASGEVWSELERVLTAGPPFGVCPVLTAKDERAVPSALASAIPERLVMRLGGRHEYAAMGLRSADLPSFVPGRALRLDDLVELQLVEPPRELGAHIAGLGAEPADARPPMRVDSLPSHVVVDDVVAAASASPRELRAAVGLDTRTGSPAVATIPFGEAYLVSGRSRSARSAVMRAIASSAKHADPEIRVFAVEAPGGDLSTGDAVDDRPLGPDDVAAWVERIATWTGRRIVLVDDADRLGGASFDRLAALADDQVAVVAAGRVESLRTTGHWTTPLHGWRRGALIRPTASDGELLGVALADDAARLARHAGLLVDHGSTTPFMAVVGEHHAPAEPSRR